MISAGDMEILRRKLDQAFTIANDAEISVEIDPNDMSDDRYAGLKELGITRASLGVQDFDPKVQTAINRIQTFADTAAWFRDACASGSAQSTSTCSMVCHTRHWTVSVPLSGRLPIFARIASPCSATPMYPG